MHPNYVLYKKSAVECSYGNINWKSQNRHNLENFMLSCTNLFKVIVRPYYENLERLVITAIFNAF
jgi:hypothetical protein